MSDENMQVRPEAHGRAWPLYGAAFMMAISLSMAWTAMPFVLSAMGGTNAHVGYAPAVNTLAYMIALLAAGSWFGHLRVRRTTLLAATIALLATAAMSFCVFWAEWRAGVNERAWVWTLIAAGGIGGAAMALYWPFLMSWVSADYEGVQLNRRFGRYNGAWSSGGTIGPLIGGRLFEVDAVIPLAVAVVFVLLSLLLLRFGRDGSARKAATVPAAGMGEIAYDMRLLGDCRWVSRIALFSVCASYAILRSQFALVFRDLGYAERQFGMYLTIYALCNFAALVAAGRWACWHFKPVLLIVGQATLLLTLLLTIYGRTLGVFFASAVLLGVAYGFAYSSHLYYGASASRKRSARMAIHEIVISVGLTIGSFAGGYLAEHVGLYTPYWFAIGLVGTGLAGQLGLHLAARRRVTLPKQAAATGEELVE
ncbi:MAG: MFS transporter [Planctomycetes bacterium]|jgi:MFS family permease|nr:MFS transporter [Planctomycetota bacterium]